MEIQRQNDFNEDPEYNSKLPYGMTKAMMRRYNKDHLEKALAKYK